MLAKMRSITEPWWKALPLSPVERLQVRHFWQRLHQVDELIEETEAYIAHQSAAQPWNDPMPFLLQLPGVGLDIGMTILSTIGAIAHFPSAQHVVGYAGLGTPFRASGDVQRTGKVTTRLE